MQTRRLAAIMFTDIAGYTALMQSDEAKALAMRNRHREVFESLHKQYNGKILQYYGDGTLSIFDSAIEAANCAIAMQLAFQEEPKVPLRIGIHTGDILYSEEEAVGDGVNVASRIESMATPGSIMISDTVHEYLKNQADIPLTSMGSFQFKNVERKMEVFAVSREGLNVPNPQDLTGKFAPKVAERKPFLKRIPVWGQYIGGFVLFLILAPFLYFPIFNLVTGNAQENAEITNENGEKIAREIIRFEDKKRFWVASFDNLDDNKENDWLRVALPYVLEMEWDQDPYIHNVYEERYLDRNLKYHMDAAELSKCPYILRGEFSQDSLYRVDIDILNATTGQDQFQLSFANKDLFNLIDEISVEVKRKLGVPEDHISQTADLPVAQYLTESEEAFKVFMEGAYISSGGGFKAMHKFEEAADLDPSFAWAGYVSSLYHHLYQRSDRKANKYIDQAMDHRTRLPDIFEIDVRILNYKIKGEYEKALKLTEVLAQLNPGNSLYINDLLSEYLKQDKYEKLLEAIEKQRKLTGKKSIEREREAIAYLRLGQPKKARKVAEKMLKDAPDNVKAIFFQGAAEIAEEKWEEARGTFEKLLLLNPESGYSNGIFDHIDFMEDSSQSIDFSDLHRRFVGKYWIEDFANFEIQILEMNDLLYVYPPGQSKMLLYPFSQYKYSTFQGFSIEFLPNEAGEVTKTLMTEGNNPPYSALRIESEIEAVFTNFKAGNFSTISPKLDSLASLYPHIPSLKPMKAHIDFTTNPEFSAASYSDFVGKYAGGNISCEITLVGDKLYFELFGIPIFQDAFPLYEIESELFMNLAALNGRLKILRKKGKVSGIELTMGGRSGGLVMERI